MRLTVGSEEPKTYWKRRAVAGGTLIVLILGVVLGCRALTSGGTDDESAESVATNEPTAPAPEDATPSRDVKQPYVDGEEDESPEPEPTEEDVTTCEEEAVNLQVVPAYDTATAGSELPVSVIVTNNGQQPCLAPVEELHLVALAGDEQVFSSTDCDDPYEPESDELDAGDGEAAQFNFEGLATSEGCEEEPRRLPSGEYELKAIMDDWESEPESVELD